MDNLDTAASLLNQAKKARYKHTSLDMLLEAKEELEAGIEAFKELIKSDEHRMFQRALRECLFKLGTSCPPELSAAKTEELLIAVLKEGHVWSPDVKNNVLISLTNLRWTLNKMNLKSLLKDWGEGANLDC
ncbi:MAG: hypothetical protein KDH96_07260 [Candidatus Riesia sp.]|nr:hypothetical protein [Candidatus Riesia sp.]